MGHSLLAYLAHYHEGMSTRDALDPQYVASPILGLANDIQAILGDALTEATTMFPHKTPATPSKGTLPRHRGLKSVRHDVSNIRRRAKVIRRLIKHETKPPAGAQEEPSLEDPSLPLWHRVDTPLSLRTVLSPPPKNLDTLGVFMRPDPISVGTTTLQAAQDRFKGVRKPTRLLICHARNFHRLIYGK